MHNSTSSSGGWGINFGRRVAYKNVEERLVGGEEMSLNCQSIHRLDGWADGVEHRQAFFRDRHLLHHAGVLLLLVSERLWLDELSWWWRRDGRHVEDRAVRWTKCVRENARRARLVGEEASVAGLVLNVRHCRWNRSDGRCLAIRPGRHAHRLHAVLLLLLQACMISRNLSVVGQRFLWWVNEVASARESEFRTLIMPIAFSRYELTSLRKGRSRRCEMCGTIPSCTSGDAASCATRAFRARTDTYHRICIRQLPRMDDTIPSCSWMGEGDFS